MEEVLGVMKKIETEADVLKWADEVVAADGERFTPLTKGEQFLIAKCIIDMKKRITTDGKRTGEVVTPINAMPRMYAYHRKGLTAQQVYDKFLGWCAEHPQSKEVMDFSTGHKSTDAAFAYWLSELVMPEPEAERT